MEEGYQGVQHLVYVSSSSVYGGNKKVPFSTNDGVDNPVSLYSAIKNSNELFAHCYSKLYNIPTMGLRLFTSESFLQLCACVFVSQKDAAAERGAEVWN